jgi:hypothetical protein
MPLVVIGFSLPLTAKSTTIFQTPNSQYVAWEAEDVHSIVNSPPNQWMVVTDNPAVGSPASGGRALYQAGENANPLVPPGASRASYSILFSTPGTYYLYHRWRADEAFMVDPLSANSFYLATTFGEGAAPELVSASNNTRQGDGSIFYEMFAETQTLTVTQEQVDTGVPLIWNIGTREAGMFIDRMVLSLNSALTEAEFNGLANSETSNIAQGAGQDFVAFEAEWVSRVANSPPNQWMVVNDNPAVGTPASGGRALYQAGENANPLVPPGASRASYSILFSTPGIYYLYHRWRADEAFMVDPLSANSFYLATAFGEGVAPEPVSASNNTRQGDGSIFYEMFAETQTLTVTQEQVDAGVPLIWNIGTREAGMFIDRMVLSLNSALTEAEFNGLPNSGSTGRPTIVRAIGSASHTRATVNFDRPLNASSVVPGNFTVSGGVTVTAAVLDPLTSRDVILTTTAQTAGESYVITVNGVTDVGGNEIDSDSQVSFTAWVLSPGWITREVYSEASLLGNLVDEMLVSPAFPDSPVGSELVRSVGLGADLPGGNYGLRFRSYFIPPTSGAYQFGLSANVDGWFTISTDHTEANLIQPHVILSDPIMTLTYTSGSLTAGQPYLFEVLFRPALVLGIGPANLALRARPAGTPGSIDDAPHVGGDLVATYVDPDAGVLDITRQPADATVPLGSRARLEVVATAPSGARLLHQWRLNGVDIPAATRPIYVTPILGAEDNGNRYSCVISVAGTEHQSDEAVITIGPEQPARYLPYIGVNFSTGGDLGTPAGMVLDPTDVTGVVWQEFFNDLAGQTFDGIALHNAQGAPTPVTLTALNPENEPITLFNLGVFQVNNSADDALLRAGVTFDDSTPITIHLSGVPADTYDLIVYSVGFNYLSSYEQDYSLVGMETYPTFTVRAQHGRQYSDNPGFHRMTSTDPNDRGNPGNYVRFENVSPATDGSLTLTVTPQPENVGNINYFPPISALQLVRFDSTVDPPGGEPLRIAINFAADEPAGVGSPVTGTAGVLGTAVWNNVEGQNGSASNLNAQDEEGAPVATSATVTWQSNNTWRSGAGQNLAPDGNDRNLMTGYLDTSEEPTLSVTVAGVPFDSYDVYVYVLSDNHEGGRGGDYTIGAQTINHVMEATFDGTYAQSPGGHYIVFRGLSGDSFTLATTPTLGSPRRAPLNAIEIVPAALAGPVFTSVRVVDGQLTLEWTGAATLLSAPVIAGPFTDVSGATSPHTTPATDAARFFLLRQ